MLGQTSDDALGEARENLDKYDAMSKSVAAKIAASNAKSANLLSRTRDPGPMHGPPSAAPAPRQKPSV